MALDGEDVARLELIRDHDGNDLSEKDVALLTRLIDGEEAEERVEYRVVGEEVRDDGNRTYASGPRPSLPSARYLAKTEAQYAANVRIQKRTRTESPWTDLPDSEEGR